KYVAHPLDSAVAVGEFVVVGGQRRSFVVTGGDQFLFAPQYRLEHFVAGVVGAAFADDFIAKPALVLFGPRFQPRLLVELLTSGVHSAKCAVASERLVRLCEKS